MHGPLNVSFQLPSTISADCSVDVNKFSRSSVPSEKIPHTWHQNNIVIYTTTNNR